MAPWARGHGLARMIAEAVENHARKLGVTVLNLDVRETQEAAITLYRSLGYHEIGRHPHYARVDGEYVAGLYFWKDLQRKRSVCLILFPGHRPEGRAVRAPRQRRHGAGDGVQYGSGGSGSAASPPPARSGCIWSISTAPSRASR